MATNRTMNWSKLNAVTLALGLTLGLGVLGCNPAPTGPGDGGGGGTTPEATPSPAPFVGVTTTVEFNEAADAALFVDPTTEEQRATGRFSSGNWVIRDGWFAQTREAQSATLMFRRYNGAALGLPNGQAVSRYRVETLAQPYQAVPEARQFDIAGYPTGIVGMIPYYLDPTHYILLIATPQTSSGPSEASLWVVDGLMPGDNWDVSVHRKWRSNLKGEQLQVGTNVQWGAEVDTKAKTITVFLNGEQKETLTLDFIQDVQHSVSLISNGNFVQYDWLRLTPLSAE